MNLPLAPKTKILRPEQAIIKIGHDYIDFGALCYRQRSSTSRRPGKPRSVVLSSLLPKRIEKIAKAIKFLSIMFTDGAQRPASVHTFAGSFKRFMDWADVNGHYDCLAGGTATVTAFRFWAEHATERLRRHEIRASTAYMMQSHVCDMLEWVTGQKDLSREVRLVSLTGLGSGAEPALEDEFAQVLALNQALFDGLCNLVLDNQAFPFKLNMPKFLGWVDSHLWIFPGQRWHLAPHLWTAREGLKQVQWANDYENGRVATVNEILHRYQGGWPSTKRLAAERAVGKAVAQLDAANDNPRHRKRIDLAMIAQSAFLFLFLCNTGCNLAVAQVIETDETIDASTLNQNYRSVKYRAEGKVVSVVSPASFMPTLRRFMELRKYLLNHVHYPYLFFTLGHRIGEMLPGKIHEQALAAHYVRLLKICPSLPRIGSRKIRATVDDYYRRTHDGAIAARVMGHSEEVADRNYLAGSAIDHQNDMTIFLDRVSIAARNQIVVATSEVSGSAKTLEEGGRCSSFGSPEPISTDMPMPNCKEGCLFCVNRILVANEEDVRKVASAAFVMEQLILGPLSEAEFRPQIQKCDQDLEKIAGIEGCEAMVAWVKRDVYENGNLTPYFADKYQMFLELGIL